MDIPPEIRKAISDMIGELPVDHKAHAEQALLQSWEQGGEGVTIKDRDGIQHVGQWSKRPDEIATGPMWLGSVCVLIAANRAVAQVT